MKFLLSFLVALFCSSIAFSQVKCYKGSFRMSSDLCYRIDNNQLYRSTGTFRDVEYLFVSGSVVYFGRKGDMQNPLYTFQKDKIYKGNSTMNSDLLYTIYDNGIYPGTSTVSSDCLYSVDKGMVYRGTSTSLFDILLSCDKETLSPEELLLLIAAVLPY